MKRIRAFSLKAAFLAAFFVFYGLGTFLAWKSIISREVILTDSIIFFSYQRPFLFGVVFAGEVMTGLTGSVIAFWLVKKFIQQKSLFIAGAVLVFTAGIGMMILAFFGNRNHDTGHLITFILLGLFMIILGILLIQVHVKQNE